MTKDLSPIGPHPSGEQSPVELGALAGPVVVDSFAGSVRVEWNHAAAFTPFGQLPFFIDFLKTAGLFEAFVADCPLNYRSPNVPQTQNGDVVDAVGAQALLAYRCATRRRRAARASRFEEDRQRGRGAARLRGDRGSGWGGVASRH